MDNAEKDLLNSSASSGSAAALIGADRSRISAYTEKASKISEKIKSNAFVSKAWKILTKVRRFFPITSMGLVYAALLTATHIYLARSQSDIVWITGSITLSIVGAIMLAAVLIGTFFVHSAWKDAFEKYESEAVTGQCGLKTPSGLILKLPPIPFIEVDIHWLSPLKSGAFSEHFMTKAEEFIEPERRCSTDSITRLITVKDILGLASVSWEHTQNTKVKIYPAKGKMNNSSVTFSMSGGEDISDPFGSPEGDLIEMRQYAPGDSSRSILWKVFARSRKLVVRMPERAVTAKPRTCAYLISGAEDEASAGMARLMLESRMLGDNWCFGADGCTGTAETLSAAMDFIAQSGNLSSSICGLQKFLSEADKRGYHNCFVFVPASWGSWIHEAKRAAQSTHIAITWVMGFDYSLETEKKKKAWEKYVYEEEKGIKLPPSAIAQALHTASSPLVLCERTTGSVIDNAAAYFKAHGKAAF